MNFDKEMICMITHKRNFEQNAQQTGEKGE